jgi:uncharacterized repeat protein (TIGR02543 family)
MPTPARDINLYLVIGEGAFPDASVTVTFSTYGPGYTSLVRGGDLRPSVVFHAERGILWSTAVPNTPIPVPSPGKRFAGWERIAGNLYDLYNIPSGFIINEDIHFKAMFEERDDFTVHYNTNGGLPEAIPSLEGVSWTQEDLLPKEEPTKVGYDFVGWNVTSGGDAVNVSATDSYGDLAQNDTTTAITLTAQWEEVIPPGGIPATTMIVQYNSNHLGTGGVDLYFIHPDMLTKGYVVGDDYTVKSYTHETKVSSEGWILPGNYAELKFTGWNTKPDGLGAHYYAGDIIRLDEDGAPVEVVEATFEALEEIPMAETVIISLYAQWKLVEEELAEEELVEESVEEGEIASPSRAQVRPQTPQAPQTKASQAGDTITQSPLGTHQTKAPQTGDTMAQSLILYLALVLLSLTTLTLWFGFNRTKKKVQIVGFSL